MCVPSGSAEGFSLQVSASDPSNGQCFFIQRLYEQKCLDLEKLLTASQCSIIASVVQDSGNTDFILNFIMWRNATTEILDSSEYFVCHHSIAPTLFICFPKQLLIDLSVAQNNTMINKLSLKHDGLLTFPFLIIFMTYYLVLLCLKAYIHVCFPCSCNLI